MYAVDYVYCFGMRVPKTGVVERWSKGQQRWKPAKSSPRGDGYAMVGIKDLGMVKRNRLVAWCWLGLKNLKGIKAGVDLIDHINHDKLDDRIENLRIVTGSGNQHNRIGKGWAWNHIVKKYQAKIKANGKQIHIGYFDTKQETTHHYLLAKLKYHPTCPVDFINNAIELNKLRIQG